MRKALLICSFLIILAGCSDTGLTQNKKPINRVIISDFNWETGITTKYEIDTAKIIITNSRSDLVIKERVLSENESIKLRQHLDNIEEIYNGHYSDDRVTDGVFVEFEFLTDEGATTKTSLNNIKIQSYARLTEYISSLVDPDIQYHQYRMKTK